MSILPVINFFRQAFFAVFSVLSTVQFEFLGVTTSLLDIFFAGIVISMVISIFWKGAKG